ncbi:hypothetical protein JG687_00017007 [Phytophthora cactorum]|uniref:Uncharacterized protein n=1 Tax=Phytophthora cactorum TaxID=29920 RepID=A0A8T1TP81_9STRA|nr:hypothetical protein JG687_00017007 [Phytophthora cactorum]
MTFYRRFQPILLGPESKLLREKSRPVNAAVASIFVFHARHDIYARRDRIDWKNCTWIWWNRTWN